MKDYNVELKGEIKALKDVFTRVKGSEVKVIFTQSKYDNDIVEVLVIITKPSIETVIFTFISGELYDMNGKVTLSNVLKVKKILEGKI